MAYAGSPVLHWSVPALHGLRTSDQVRLAVPACLGRRGLTRREAQIARLLARRASNREIAEQLDVSPHTVRHHIENIFAKLGVHSRRSIFARFE